jgi:RimJ/RimL family protein N-acetyltransferase
MNANPIARDIPTRLESERLIIRCPAPGDGAAVHAGVVDSLDALRQFPASLPWAMFEPSVEESEKYCREGQAKYLMRTEMPMLLFLKDGDIYVGGSGLHAFDWTVPKCETGYWIRTAYRGRGLALEAAMAITTFALDTLGMRRVEALPDDDNVASSRVCERAGYELEGVMRSDRAEPDGTLRNTRIYAITR